MTDEFRPEYKRSDFGEIVRGKYAKHIKPNRRRFSLSVIVLAMLN